MSLLHEAPSSSNGNGSTHNVRILKTARDLEPKLPDFALWEGDVERFLNALPHEPIFDLIVTSPPYNIGKLYEKRSELDDYLLWQSRLIDKLVPRLKPTGSLCWQVGNYVDDGEILPLDIEFAPIFRTHKLQLRNRIVWHFGHGLHSKRRFSGRYEVVLWYSKTKDYIFNLDAVRVPSKYPGKRHFKGPRSGALSGNPLGKNPEDVWSIPNCKLNCFDTNNRSCRSRRRFIKNRTSSASPPSSGTVHFTRGRRCRTR